MSGGASTRPRTRRTASPWLLAALAAVAWHAAIAAGLRPRPAAPPPAAPPGPPAFTYRPGAAALDESDLVEPGWVALHTPILFALPSPVGFAAPRQHPERHPDLGPPVWPLRLLPRSLAPVTEAAVLLPPSLEESARRRLAELEAAAEPPRPRPPAGWAEWSVSGLDEPTVAGLGFPLPPEERGDAAWEARASVTFGADGRPCRVLLDEPPADAVVAGKLVTGLYRWRIPPPSVARRVQALLRYEGRAAAAPEAP